MATTPVDSPAVNAPRTTYAAGLDGASDDPPRPVATQPSSTSNQLEPNSKTAVQLTPDQVRTIAKFEQKRSEQILRTPVPAAKDMAFVAVEAPLTTKEMKFQFVAKKTSQVSFVKWIGKVAPAGLIGVYFHKNPYHKSKQTFKALACYRNQSYLENLKKAVLESKPPFQWDGFDAVIELTLAGDQPQSFVNNADASKTHLTYAFAAALASASEYLIRSGAMSVEDYDACQQGGVLRPQEADPKKGNYGVGYFGEMVEVNGRPIQVWALAGLSNGAAFSRKSSRPATNGDHASTEDPGIGASTSAPGSDSPAEPVSVSGTSTAATTPHTSGPAASESAESTEETYEPPETVRVYQRTTLAYLSRPEQELQRRYFGAADTSDPVHCMTCGKLGHMEEECPSRTCTFCQAVDMHFSKDCPTRAKCRKCRERGHTIEDCTSKLFRSKADGIVCDYCQSKEHFEDQCTWVWRTFNPEELPHINKVDRLSMGCYFCGSDGHWGDDCRMLPKDMKYQFDVFSAKEAARYLIDPLAHPSNGTLNGGFSIKGSAQSNPIEFDDDDDDLDDSANFYRNARPSNNRGGGGGLARGSIRINAGGGGNRRRSRSPPHTRSGNFRQRNDNQFQPVNGGGYHALPPNPYGAPVPASRGGGYQSGRGGGGGGQVLGRGGARNGRGRGGSNNSGGGGRSGGGSGGYGGNNRPPPPPPPPASSSSRGRGRKNKNKK
ncbi:uncharacterized protein J3D65DRAFT_599756 [Phyllosticta citribraziliensis]|uniref:CCHC-type domain-containing protein n=1 Tax=Phyllosticta citribraziliensis TaxID=989973 RepID=A0ABR1M2W4_9PEZI